MAPKKRTLDNEEPATTQESLSPSAKPIETFTALQNAVEAGDINDHAAQLLELMSAAECPSTPLLMRVRFLEFIGHVLAKVRDSSALKSIVASLVKIICGEDNSAPLLCATIRCFEGLGPVSTADSSFEFLARESVDILLQIILDREAFEENVRKAALSVLNALTESAFCCVVKKLLHWLSDEREDDEEEWIRGERHAAGSRLLRLALSPSMRKHWTESVQKDVLSLIQRLLFTVDVREFTQLMTIASSFSSVKDKGGAPLLEMFLATDDLEVGERWVESLAIIGKFVKDSATFDLTSILVKNGLLQKDLPVAGEHAVYLSRVLLLAARVTPSESAGPLVQYVSNQLDVLVGDGADVLCDFSILEAVLLSFVQLSKKQGPEVLAKLNDEAFRTHALTLAHSLDVFEAEALFAVKKMVEASEATLNEAELLACLLNCKNIATQFSDKRIPSAGITESWAAKVKLPVLKRGRQDAPSTGPLSNPNHRSNADQPKAKSRRFERGPAPRRR